jgi:hypothetical protein
VTRLRARLPLVVLAGAGAAAALRVAGGDPVAIHATLFAAALVAGELLVLRLEDGTGVPLSYAPMLVLTVGFAADDAAITILLAQLVALALRVDSRHPRHRWATFVQRLAVAAGALAASRATFTALGRRESLTAVLTSIGAAVVAAFAVDQVARRAQRLRPATSARGSRAWSALGATGALMALGYRGVGGEGRVELWTLVLFAIPLLAAWYSFERLAAASRTHRQTLRALSMATELGGFVTEGHGERVAELCERLGADLGLPPDEVEDLVAAAYLHHLGVLTLDDPPAAGTRGPVGIVAAVTSAMLGDIPMLSNAGAIVAGQPAQSRAERSDPPQAQARRASQILKVASDFDDVSRGDPSEAGFALEALYSSPGYVYDRRVLEALERVIDRGVDRGVDRAGV